MKKDVHPKYYPDAIIHCSCRKTFKIGSTKPEIQVEVCSACHPFYTGQDKIIDTAGRVEKFKKRVAQAKEKKKKPAKASTGKKK
jgi:large subunit ribosomal protein L31